MDTVNDLLNFLIEEANNFNAGASWGTSPFANVIIEVVARYYEKKTGKKYDTTNRLYKDINLTDFKNIAEEELKIYTQHHTYTCRIVEHFLDKL